MIPGRATAAGTARFRQRFPELARRGHFRPFGDLWLSSIGLGTYLGEADDATDQAYEEAIRAALVAGCNVFDTAINYRHQRSERTLGRALERAFTEGIAARDEVFVSTKGGYLPFDQDRPPNPRAYLQETYLATGLLSPDELVAGCHALAPAFLEDQLVRSRHNLGLETVDLYYLHNPETQLAEIPREALYRRLGEAFRCLEGAVSRDEMESYGLATWSAFRVPPAARDHLNLAQVAEVAREAALRNDPAYRAIQLPFNLAMPEALAAPTQEYGEVTIPLLVLARKLKLGVFASASILQGRLARNLPTEIAEAFLHLRSDAQRALQFTRSAPGVTVALVGMARREHVAENLALAGVEPAGVEVFHRLLG